MTHKEEKDMQVAGIEVPNDPEVVASLVHLLQIQVLEDGQTVGRFPLQMAMFERDLFDRSAEVLISLGGVLNREVEGFLLPANIDIAQFIEALLDEEPVMIDNLQAQGF
jgi:hypothetical protein